LRKIEFSFFEAFTLGKQVFGQQRGHSIFLGPKNGKEEEDASSRLWKQFVDLALEIW
jgi:hypothetical protein